MNLLHLVASISPESGGPTEVIRLMTRHAPPGDSAEVVTLDDPSAPFLRDFDFPIHALGSATKRWYSPKLLPWLRANRHRFDAALIHGLWQYPGLAARLALRGHIPYAVFPHGMLDPYFKRDRLKHFKKQLYWLLFESKNLRSAHRVLFTTQREHDLAQQTFWPSHWSAAITPLGTEPFLFVIPKPGPPTGAFARWGGKGPASPSRTTTTASTTEALAAFHQRCPGLQDKPFLLYLGRIDPKKGCDLLIRAFADIQCHRIPKPTVLPGSAALKGPGFSPAIPGPAKSGASAPEGANANLHLLIAGPDPNHWQSTLMQTIDPATAARIHFPGLLTGPAKHGALAACDAFILPSHQENFGIAVVEALAAGKPVLISDQVNIAPDILADHCGLVEADTLDGTRRLLERWLALTPEDRATMSANARTTFAIRYDMRCNTAAIFDIFRPL